MSQFKTKVEDFKLLKLADIPTKFSSNSRHACSAQIKIKGCCSPSPRSELIQQPIIICKKQKKQSHHKKTDKNTKVEVKSVKKVEPFVPISIPALSPRAKIDTKFKRMFENTEASTPVNHRQIQIHIQKDTKDDKECLRKLFKKIHKLTEDLGKSQKQRIRLELQLENLKNIDGVNRGNEKGLLKLEGQNYKLRSDADYFKDLLAERNKEINALKNKVPTQVIKQIVVQKPVQVKIEVPKYIPGPEKIVQVPKYIENKMHDREIQTLQKQISALQNELSLERAKNLQSAQIPVRDTSHTPYSLSPHSIPQIIQKPVYLEKPIYIDRPIYIDKPVQRERIVEVPVEVPYQVPYEVPVYVEKPIIDDQLYLRIAELEREVQTYFMENQEIRQENMRLKSAVAHLQSNIEILRRHNNEKNHEIESLLKNPQDYSPIRMRQLMEKQTMQKNIQNRSRFQIGNTFNPRQRN